MTEQQQNDKTHFGFTEVASNEKKQMVREVFDSVAQKYDLMNDLMSLGMHRLWKRFTISKSGVRPGQKVLDIAAGTGDLSKLFYQQVGKKGMVIQSDINFSMLQTGRDRLIDQGIITPALLCNAEQLPFAANSFDIVSVAFGLRNMTDKLAALKEMQRVLKPGGRLLVLEFSQVAAILKPIYEQYLFKLIPQIGKIVASDSESYRYLAESIYMHPDQETLAEMMRHANLQAVEYFNLNAGVVALHRGIKFL